MKISTEFSESLQEE